MGYISILTQKKSLREVSKCLSLLFTQFQAHHNHLLGKPHDFCTFMVFKLEIIAEKQKVLHEFYI